MIDSPAQKGNKALVYLPIPRHSIQNKANRQRDTKYFTQFRLIINYTSYLIFYDRSLNTKSCTLNIKRYESHQNFSVNCNFLGEIFY